MSRISHTSTFLSNGIFPYHFYIPWFPHANVYLRRREEPFFAARYAPYKPESEAFFAQGLEKPIPPSTNPAVGA